MPPARILLVAAWVNRQPEQDSEDAEGAEQPLRPRSRPSPARMRACAVSIASRRRVAVQRCVVALERCGALFGRFGKCRARLIAVQVGGEARRLDQDVDGV